MKNSPLKQNYTKKRSKAGMILDPAGFFQTHEAPPAIIDPSGETSAFKMRGYSYPGKSPLHQGKNTQDGTGTNQGITVEGDRTKGKWGEKLKNMAGSDFVKDVAVGAVVSMLSKPKKSGQNSPHNWRKRS